MSGGGANGGEGGVAGSGSSDDGSMETLVLDLLGVVFDRCVPSDHACIHQKRAVCFAAFESRFPRVLVALLHIQPLLSSVALAYLILRHSCGRLDDRHFKLRGYSSPTSFTPYPDNTPFLFRVPPSAARQMLRLPAEVARGDPDQRWTQRERRSQEAAQRTVCGALLDAIRQGDGERARAIYQDFAHVRLLPDHFPVLHPKSR